MSGDLPTQFTNSCITIEYPCLVGEKYIDPCSCFNYYECEHQTNIIRRTCGELMYNHENTLCESREDVEVTKGLCKESASEERCLLKYNDSNVPALKARCDGVPWTSVTAASPTPSGPPGGQEEGSNTGAIVGGVIGGLLLIAVIVILVVFLKKRKGKPMRHFMDSLSQKKSAEKQGRDDEETYTEINDVMRDPMYNGDVWGGKNEPPVPDRPSFTLSPALNVSQSKVTGRSNSNEVAYDNPGYTPADDDHIIQMSRETSTHTVPVDSVDTADQVVPGEERYSSLDRETLEVPSARSYTPLSIYTKGPNTKTSPDSGGLVHVTNNDYQVPKPLPDYYDLQPGSNSVS